MHTKPHHADYTTFYTLHHTMQNTSQNAHYIKQYTLHHTMHTTSHHAHWIASCKLHCIMHTTPYHAQKHVTSDNYGYYSHSTFLMRIHFTAQCTPPCPMYTIPHHEDHTKLCKLPRTARCTVHCRCTRTVCTCGPCCSPPKLKVSAAIDGCFWAIGENNNVFFLIIDKNTT